MMQGRGAMLAFWDDVLPAMPDELKAEHLRIVAESLATRHAILRCDKRHVHFHNLAFTLSNDLEVARGRRTSISAYCSPALI